MKSVTFTLKRVKNFIKIIYKNPINKGLIESV